MSDKSDDLDNDIVSRIMDQSGVGDDERAGMEDDSSGTKSVEKQSNVSDDEGEESVATSKPDVDNTGEKQRVQPAKNQQTQKKPEPLVDENRNVIAQGGAERRLFEKYRKTAEIEVPALQREVQAYKEAANFSKYELNAQEAITGYSLVKAWKEDPAKLIKHLLTQAKTAGINVDIGQAGVDTDAIRAMIDDRMRPLTEARQQREQQAEASAEAERQYEAFTEQFPDAIDQEEAIATLISKDADMTPREAYYAVKSFIAENGLTWNIPLKQQRATGSKTPVIKQQPGMPRTRQTVQVQNDDNDDRSAPVLAPAGSSWADIIKSSMKDAGYYKQ